MSKQASLKKHKNAAVGKATEKKKIALEGLPTTDAVQEEPKKKKIIKKVKNGKDEKEDSKPKKSTKTNSNEKTIKKTSKDKDDDDDNNDEDVVIKKKPAAAVEPKKTISISKKKECSEEKREQLTELVENINNQLKALKALGYLIDKNGQVYYPAKKVLEPTDIDVEIVIQDRYVQVNTGTNRDGNTTLLALGGRWLNPVKAWSIPLKSLPDLRKYFNVVEEKKLSKEEIEELREKIQKSREDKMQPGDITIKDEGDYFVITSPNAATKLIMNELKQDCRASWNPSQLAWIVNATYKEELEKLLEEALEEGKIKKYEFSAGVLANLED